MSHLYHNPKRCLLAAALAVCCLLSSRLAMAATSALVTEVSGEASVSNGSEVQNPLLAGMELTRGQVVKTGADGHVVLLVDGDSRVEVYPHTVMEMGDVLPGEENDLSMSLYLGRIAMNASSLSANDVVHTPLLTIGIRGTRFAVSVADDGASVVSVEQGRVQVSTERIGASDIETQLEPGQEVEAVEAGQELSPRQILYRSFEEWNSYRLSRRRHMVEDLPKLAAQLERAIDPELERLDWIKLQPMNRAEVLRELDGRLEELAPDDTAGRAQVIMQTHMEMARSQGLPERFRAQRTRLRAIFIQADLYQELIQGYFTDLGPQHAAVSQTLSRIQSREGEVMSSARRISTVFRESMSPIQDIFREFENQQ